MSEPNARVFISYSRKNSEFAQSLYQTLSEENYKLWVDWQNIEGAENWWAAILEGIAASDIFVFIVSQHSLTSEICNQELSYARQKNKKIVSVIVETIENEIKEKVHQAWRKCEWEAEARDNWSYLKEIQWIDFDKSEWDFQSYKKLEKTLNQDLHYVKQHTDIALRAKKWERSEKNESFLFNGDELASAEVWLNHAINHNKKPKPTKLHHQFIHQSRKSENEREAKIAEMQKRSELLQNQTDELKTETAYLEKQTTRFRKFSLIAAVVGILAISVGIFASIQRNQALTASNIASTDAAQAAINVRNANIRVTQAATEIARAETEARSANIQITNASEDLATANIQVTDAIRNSNVAATNEVLANQRIVEVENTVIPATLNAVATDVQSAQNFSRSLEIAAQAQNIYNDTNNLQLARTLGLEASYIDMSPQVHNALSRLAYIPSDRRRYLDHSRGATSLIFDPSGEKILSGACSSAAPVRMGKYSCEKGEIILREVTSGNVLYRLEEHEGWITSLAFSPDGENYVSASHDVFLRDTMTGEIIRQFSDPDSWVTDVEFSPDGQEIIASLSNSNLVRWDVSNGEVLNTYTGHTDDVTSIAFLPHGRSFISASRDDTIIQWHTSTGSVVRRYEAHTDDVQHVAMNPNGQEFISASADNTIIRWEIVTAHILQRYEGHTSIVTHVEFSPDGQQILSGSWDQTIILWDKEDGSIIRQYRGHRDFVNAVAFSPDGKHFTSGSYDYQLILWDVMHGAIEQHDVCEICKEIGVSFTALSSEAELIFVGFSKEGIILDVTSQVVLQRIENLESSSSLTSATFSKDSRELLTTTADGKITIWEVETGNILYKYNLNQITDHINLVNNISFTDDEEGFFVSDSRKIITIERRSGEIISTIPIPENTFIYAIKPDREQILISTLSNDFQLIEKNGTMITNYDFSNASLPSAAFSPDGQKLAIEGTEGEIILFDPLTGNIYTRLPSITSDSIRHLTFSPDGYYIVSVSVNDVITIWENQSFEQLRQWTHENRFLPDLSCEQRIAYNLPDDRRCSNDRLPPSPTFAPTRTPILNSE